MHHNIMENNNEHYMTCLGNSGLKIYFTGPSDKMSGDVVFVSDICPMTFSSVLTRK
jgi:hypothetical protein